MKHPSRLRLTLAALALFSCSRVPESAFARSAAPTACVGTAAAGQLALARSAAVAATPLRGGVFVNSRSALTLTGRCSSQVVAADGSTFLLAGGTVVGLNAPLEVPGARLELQTGGSSFDRIKVVKGPHAGRANGTVTLTDAFDPSPAVDRFAAVWPRGPGSVVGFVDVDRASGRRSKVPVFRLPLRAEVAVYRPAPDTKAGTMTVLAHVGNTARVYWIDVGM